MESGQPLVFRLHDVAFPLLVAAADWCVLDQELSYGFLIKEGEPLNEHAMREGRSAVSVRYVHPQSPAASAGLMAGDRLISVNEQTVSGIEAEAVAQLIRRMTVARIQPLQLEVLRDGSQRTLHMRAIPSCKFSVHLIGSDRINAITDGHNIGVTRGTIQFVGSDDELAWVVAHEIAHDVLNHSQDARFRAMLHAFLSATIGVLEEIPSTVPQRFLEARADYVGACIMARAGYDLRAIKQFWKRMERFQGGEQRIEMERTHPTTVERLASFELTLREIEENRRRGESPCPVSGELSFDAGH